MFNDGGPPILSLEKDVCVYVNICLVYLWHLNWVYGYWFYWLQFGPSDRKKI